MKKRRRWYLTLEQLYELAKKRDIQGRAKRCKWDLIRTLRA